MFLDLALVETYSRESGRERNRSGRSSRCSESPELPCASEESKLEAESSSWRPRSSRAGARLCLRRRHFVQFQSLTSPVEQSQVDKDDSLENHRKRNVDFVWRLNAFALGSKGFVKERRRVRKIARIDERRWRRG